MAPKIIHYFTSEESTHCLKNNVHSECFLLASKMLFYIVQLQLTGLHQKLNYKIVLTMIWINNHILCSISCLCIKPSLLKAPFLYNIKPSRTHQTHSKKKKKIFFFSNIIFKKLRWNIIWQYQCIKNTNERVNWLR